MKESFLAEIARSKQIDPPPTKNVGGVIFCHVTP